MSLKDQGFRFIYVNGAFCWLHPAEIQIPADVVDCTDMSDEEFDLFVRAKHIVPHVAAQHARNERVAAELERL